MHAAFEMSPSVEAIDATVQAVRAAAAPWLGPDGADGLEIAVSEALTNIVLHGYAGGDAGRLGEVRLDLTVDATAVRLQIVDRGQPGPADLYEAAPGLESLDVLQESGRGRALICHLALSVDYRPTPEANRLTLTFARQAPQS